MELTTVLELEEEISATRDEIESLRAKATAPSTSKIDGLGHAAPMASRVETLTVKIVDAERRLENLREEWAIASPKLSAEIVRRVTGKAWRFLFERYVEGKSVSEIADEMSLTASRVRQLIIEGKKQFYEQ